MGVAAGVPIDLILFGMIAVFLTLRLRSILGRRSGFEQPAAPDMQARPRRAGTDLKADGRADTKVEPPTPVRVPPEPTSLIGQDLARLRLMDPVFDPGRFLTGAESAFKLVVEAFAAGNRAGLRPLLTPETFQAFDAAIAAREAAGETQRTELRRITDVQITAVSLPAASLPAALVPGEQPAFNAVASPASAPAEPGPGPAGISVRFISDQINVCTDAQGRVSSGVDAVTEIRDLWLFERIPGSSEPTWRLAGARSD